MPVEQADSNRPEIDDAYADARAAFDEVTKGPAEEVAEPVEAAPEPEAKPERARDEHGKFVAKDEKAEVEAAPVQEVKTEQPVELKPDAPVEQAVQQPAGAPPGGWSVKSKAEWDKLPENIRADIVKREQEVNEGFKQYEGMRELRPYVEMAQRSGTSLKAALDNYTGLENLLRQDVVKGVSQIAANMGTHPVELAQRILQAYGQTAQTVQADPSNPQPFDPSILQQHINPLAQELQQIKHQLSQREQAEQARQQDAINSVLERFKSDPAHRYFENVEPLMSQLISSGVVQRTGDHMADLKSAYEAACYQNPEVRGLLIKEQIAKDEAGRKAREKDAAEKARQASRSITGSPSAAVREADTGKRGSSHDDARSAYNEVMARV
jgi:cytochrome c556